MSQEPADRTQMRLAAWLGALGRGDMATAMAGLAEDVVFAAPAIYRAGEPMPRPGELQGRDAIAAMFAARAELVEDLGLALHGMGGADGHGWALATTRERHRATGADYALRTAVHFTFDARGRIARWESLFDPAPQIAAFRPALDLALLDALKARDEARVARMLALGADPCARDADGLTALMIACGRDLPDSARNLLESGADPFAKDSGAGASALHKACQRGALACVRLMLEAGVPVDEPATATGHTPLIEAIWFKRPDIVACLLEAGAALNVRTRYGFALKDHLAYALKVNRLDQPRLEAAAALVRAREAADQAAEAAQPLMEAVRAGDLSGVEAALAAGAEVDARAPIVNGFDDAHTPLLVACRDGHAEIARRLIAAGADVNATEPTFGAVPLHKATYNGHAGIAALLAAEPGIDLDDQGPSNGYTPLHDALWHGFADCARVLVEAGARLDLEGHDGLTPAALAEAAFGADDRVTRLIREREAA